MRIIAVIAVMISMTTLVSCDDDKIKAKASRVLAAAVSPVLSLGLECKTGDYTYAFAKGKLYDKLNVDEINRKGFIKELCKAALNKLKDEFAEWVDSGLSPEMLADECSAEKLSQKGVAFLAGKCPG